MTTTTDRQHNHDLRVILDRLDLARAELAVAVTERDQLREKLAAMRPGLTVA